MKTNVSTTGLFKSLEKAKTLDQALESVNPNISLVDHLRAALDQSGMSIKELSQRVMASRVFIYQIFEGDRKPSRDMLLRMAFVLNLSLDDTQLLLKIAQKSPLYPRIRREAVLVFALQKHYALDAADEALRYAGEQPLLPDHDGGNA